MCLDFLDEAASKRWLPLIEASPFHLPPQQFTLEGPGTILRDVETMLEVVGPAGMVTKGKNANLPTDCLAGLNLKSGFPVKLRLQRALLRDYPNLAGTFILLRVMELLEPQGTRLLVNPQALSVWQGLNPAERYFALLEALLFQAQASVLGGERVREEQPLLEPLLSFLVHFRCDQWRSFRRRDYYRVLGTFRDFPQWALFLLQQMGLAELGERSASAKEPFASTSRGWQLGKARLTPWGKTVATGLLVFCMEEAARFEKESEQANEEEDTESGPAALPGYGSLLPIFQPHFPEWKVAYALPAREVVSGNYIFKVTLGKWHGDGKSVWRRIAIPSHLSLDELAGVILKAYKLEEDHLYDFQYRDQRGRSRVYYHPDCDEGPWASEITVEETGLPVKGIMHFLFDYGDYWRFDLRLEAVEGSARLLSKPKILESVGKAPPQYPDYDGE